MSSELELTEAGRLKLAFLISQEKAQPIREAYQPPADLSPWAVPVLANEQRRLKAAKRLCAAGEGLGFCTQKGSGAA